MGHLNLGRFKRRVSAEPQARVPFQPRDSEGTSIYPVAFPKEAWAKSPTPLGDPGVYLTLSQGFLETA